MKLYITNTWLRRFFIFFYVASMLLVSGWLCAKTFGLQRTVYLDDREVVMQRRANVIPVSVEIREDRWGSLEMDDRSQMYEISQLISRISLFRSDSPADSTNGIDGKITYIDGTSTIFTLNQNLSYGDRSFGSEDVAFELGALRKLLREEMHTLKNLAGFFVSQNSITLANDTTSHVLKSESIEQLRQSVLSSRVLTSSTDIEYHVLNRDKPAFMATIKRFGNVNDLLTLVIYDSDYAEVYDITDGGGMIMVLTGDFNTLCNRLMTVE